MVEYIWLSIVGVILFLLTASFDYYTTRFGDFDRVSETTQEDFPAIGSNDDSEEIERVAHQNLDPIRLGYLISLLLQLPGALSLLRVL